MKWLVELRPSKKLTVAFAPYHLPQDADLIAGIITDLGERLVFFQGWQYGMGSRTKLPKEQELLQLLMAELGQQLPLTHELILALGHWLP
jgi:hypothetical protein